jgi:uncharacterized protein YbjT (DUF2867 family)
MRILVTTPTGHIGSRIVDRLLAAGHAVTVLARDPSKLSDAIRDKVTVVQGALEASRAVATALTGVDSAFLLIPPPAPTTPDWRAWQQAVGTTFTSAAKAAGVARVVLLSSTGAQHDDAGPISGLGDVEKILFAALPNVTTLRAGYFMENTFGSLPTIASQGAMYGTVHGDTQQQVVATRDIGDIATRWLTDATWTGHHVAGAHGPTTISQNEQAQVLSDVLGKPVQYVRIPASALRDALLGAGLPELFANGYESMYAGMTRHLEAGDFSQEPQTEASAGTITFREFSEQALKPAFDAQLAATT